MAPPAMTLALEAGFCGPESHHERRSVVIDELAGQCIAKAPAVGSARQQCCQREAKRQKEGPEAVHKVPAVKLGSAAAHHL